MKKICWLIFLVVMMSCVSFGEAETVVNAVVPETLFVNQVNNVLFSVEEPVIYQEGQYYLPISPQFLSDLGILPVWQEDGRGLTLSGETRSLRNVEMVKEDPYLVDYKRTIKVVACDPIAVHVDVNGVTLDTEALFRDPASEIWYIPLNVELVNAMDWEYYDLGNYGQFLYFYDFTEKDQQAFLEYQKKMNAMAKYMTIINKKLDIERAAYYVQLVQKTSQKYDVEDIWILAIMWQESWYDEKCTYLNAMGMMQMLKSTGRTMGVTGDQLLDPAINIEVCVKYLTRDREHYNGDLEKAILAYNQGSVRVDRGTHKTWYYEEVHEKYGKIDAFIQDKVASL
ncbi:MAG: lytic transglycosylase domain-containing protein [Clostridia bacterium]|nr:lytic transglycosylase domain-containing protein [Clostridia bacterium]